MKTSELFAVVGIVVVFLIMLYGWVANIVYLVTTLNDPVTGMMILRIVGIPVALIGVVLGYIPG